MFVLDPGSVVSFLSWNWHISWKLAEDTLTYFNWLHRATLQLYFSTKSCLWRSKFSSLCFLNQFLCMETAPTASFSQKCLHLSTHFMSFILYFLSPRQHVRKKNQFCQHGNCVQNFHFPVCWWVSGWSFDHKISNCLKTILCLSDKNTSAFWH